MTKYTAENMELDFGGNAVPAGYLREVDWPETAGVDKNTGAGEEDETYIGTKKDATITVTMWDHNTPGSLRDYFAPKSNGTINFYPQGNSAGKPKHSCTAIVTNRNANNNHERTTPLVVTLQRSGPTTESTVGS